MGKVNLLDTFLSLTDSITVHDRDFNVLYANKAAEAFLAIDPNSIEKCYRHYHGLDAPPEFCLSCGCWQTHREIAHEYFEPKLGKFIQLRAIPQFDQKGDMAALIHIAKEAREPRPGPTGDEGYAAGNRIIENFAPI